ncbi:MAG: hypothetical protein V3S68_05380 [Dehalococcoidia bacterium]
MSETDANPVLPLGRRRPSPDVAAPDGSEIRLLVDARQGAVRSSLIEVTLGPGERLPARSGTARLKRSGTCLRAGEGFGAVRRMPLRDPFPLWT